MSAQKITCPRCQSGNTVRSLCKQKDESMEEQIVVSNITTRDVDTNEEELSGIKNIFRTFQCDDCLKFFALMEIGKTELKSTLIPAKNNSF